MTSTLRSSATHTHLLQRKQPRTRLTNRAVQRILLNPQVMDLRPPLLHFGLRHPLLGGQRRDEVHSLGVQVCEVDVECAYTLGNLFQSLRRAVERSVDE